jgi:DNA-directed RNA polymerase specialized sigma24 family protein
VEQENRQIFSEADAAKIEAELESASLPPYEGEGLPPELRAVPRDVLASATRHARTFVINKTRSNGMDKEEAKLLAWELVQDVFVKVTRTRRWNAAKGVFSRHFMLCTMSELNHHFTSKAREKEKEANEGYGREELPTHTPSVEDRIIEEQTETELMAARESKAAREVALLREKIASHELMPRVAAALEGGTTRPADIATELGVPVQKVYRALDLMRHHMQNIRDAERKEKK